MKKVAVVLSGCGVMDGSEIHESVLTLLSLDKNGAEYQCFAPNISQTKVINHLTGAEMQESRNVLVESARIARGNIKDVREAKAEDFDAVIFPGGFGAASNLSDFAVKGAECTVNKDVAAFGQGMFKAHKTLGFICIAPTLIPAICGEGIACTIGNDKEVAEKLNAMGAHHKECTVGNIIVDEKHKVVSTPAYMLGTCLEEVADGIDQLVRHILLIS